MDKRTWLAEHVIQATQEMRSIITMRATTRRAALTWQILITMLLLVSFNTGWAAVKAPPKEMSKETKECVACHKKDNPGIVQQWGSSAHYGANVGCYECHAADKKDPDAYIHDEKKVKKHISIIVSPKDCANCHEKAATEFVESHHAKGGRFIGSLDNLLAEVVEGNYCV